MYSLKIEGNTLVRCALKNRMGQTSYDEIAVVPDTVEEIGDRAFYMCALGGIKLPNGIKRIGDRAFEQATSPNHKNRYKGGEYVGSVDNPYMILIDIDKVDDTAFEVHPDTRFIDSNAYKKERWWYKNAPALLFGDKLEFIGSYAFCGAKFERVVIPETVACIKEGAFYESAALRSVVLPSGLSEIAQWLFYKCAALDEVKLPEKLEKIGGRAFMLCSSLSGIAIPSEVEEIGICAFAGCSSLKKVTMGDGVKRIGDGAFKDCAALEEIEMPASLEAIPGDIFYGCGKLKRVNIPSGVKSIGKNAFSRCSALEALDIPASVERIDGAFDGCDALKHLTVDPENKHYVMRGDILIETATGRPVFIRDGGVADDVVVAGEGKTVIAFEEYRNNTYIKNVRVAPTVRKIESGAFRGCTGLKHIELPNGLAEIGHDVFEGCTALEEIVIPKTVREFGFNVFDGCTSLERAVFEGEIDGLPSFKNCVSLSRVVAPSVGYTGYKTFIGCTALEQIELSKKLVTVGEASFSGCTALKRIVIPPRVDTIESNAFSGCTALAEVVIESKKLRIGAFAFSGCTALESLTIGAGVKLGIAALTNCDGLKHVTVSPENDLYYVRDDCLFTKDDTLVWMPAGRTEFPSGVKGIGGGMFIGSDILSFTVPDGVERIVDEAFAQSKLKEVSFPASLKTVDLDAFDQCFDIRTIYFRGTRYEFNGIDFGEDDYDPSNEDEDYFNLVMGLDYTGQIDVVCEDN